MCSQKISLCIEVIIIEIILLMKQPMFIEDFGVIFFFFLSALHVLTCLLLATALRDGYYRPGNRGREGLVT